MTPVGWMARYLFASIVGATVAVKAMEIVRLEVGDAVRGVVFRRRVHDNKHGGPDT